MKQKKVKKQKKQSKEIIQKTNKYIYNLQQFETI